MSRYLNAHRRRGTQRGTVFGMTAKGALLTLACIGMGASAMQWWEIQSRLTDYWPVAMVFTAILVIGPPALVAPFIPWSPAGMLFQRLQRRTWGFWIAGACAAYLLWYAVTLLFAYWEAQTVTRETGLVLQQVMIGVLGFIVVPALIWAPVDGDELVETAKQTELARRHDLQTEADIAILRANLFNAQMLALRGVANLTVDEREDLAQAVRGLRQSLDTELHAIADTLDYYSEAIDALPDDALSNDTAELLIYNADQLRGSAQRITK